MKTSYPDLTFSRLSLALALAGSLLLAVPVPTLHAAPPELMTYQGFLVDANGAVLATAKPENYPVVFRIYTAPTGGNLLWSEQQIVTVDKGNFSAVLGEGTPVSGEPRPVLSAAFAGPTSADRYMSISVTIGGTTSEILPRLRLLPSPYSFQASTASALVQPSGVPVINYANSRVEVSGDVFGTGKLEINGGFRARGGAPGLGGVNNNGYAFTGNGGDLDTGMFNSIDGQLDFFANANKVADFSGAGLRIPLPGAIELGAGAPGKQTDAGKIGYQLFTPDSLDIVGAGNSPSQRKVRVWAEGGTTFTGNVGIGTTAPTERLEVAGNVNVSGNISGIGVCPPGAIMPYAGDVAPPGWFLCDGSAKDRATFPVLSGILGSKFGGNIALFNVPDMRGRVPVGTGGGPGLTPRTIGQAGGEERHTMSIAELPSHNHTATDSGHTHQFPIGPGDAGSRDKAADGDQAPTRNVSTAIGFANITVGATGGSQPFNVMQPFVVLNYIIKY